MFEIGSYVSYRADGVCKIADIRKESFGVLAEPALYYVLHPIHDEKSIFFVPVDNGMLVAKMRQLLSADEITALIKRVSERPLEWIPETKPRANFFKRILSEGEREELIYLVRLLKIHTETMQSQGKKVYATDDAAAKRAAQLLFAEFSMVLPIESPNDIPAFIESVL
jgi:CarD family transcriptional regulator